MVAGGLGPRRFIMVVPANRVVDLAARHRKVSITVVLVTALMLVVHLIRQGDGR